MRSSRLDDQSTDLMNVGNWPTLARQDDFSINGGRQESPITAPDPYPPVGEKECGPSPSSAQMSLALFLLVKL